MISSRLRFIERALIMPTIFIVGSVSLSSQQPVSLSSAKTVTLNDEQFIHPVQWSGGAFIGIAAADTAGPGLVLFDREGQEFSQMTPRIPGARQIMISSQARGPDGTVAICAHVGYGYHQGEPFLVILSAQGDTQQLIRTGTYLPQRVTITPDGSIWTQGYDWKRPNDPVFRRFDRTGKLIGSFVPQSSFRDSRGDFRGALGGPHNAFVSSSDRVAFLCGREHRYIEISLDGKVTDISFTGGSSSEWLSGLALTKDGKIFVSTDDVDLRKYNFYLLDTKNRTLLPAPHSTSLSWEVLAGTDGDSLVALGGNMSGGRAAFYLVSQ